MLSQQNGGRQRVCDTTLGTQVRRPNLAVSHCACFYPFAPECTALTAHGPRSYAVAETVGKELADVAVLGKEMAVLGEGRPAALEHRLR